MRLKGAGDNCSELLEAAGVNTVSELKYWNPATRAKAIAQANQKRKLARALPSNKAIAEWIEHARSLRLNITY